MDACAGMHSVVAQWALLFVPVPLEMVGLRDGLIRRYLSAINDSQTMLIMMPNGIGLGPFSL